MRAGRFLVVVALVATIVALAVSWGGSAVDRDDSLAAPPIPTAGAPDGASSTWFCAASSAGTDPVPRHVLVLSNPAGEAGEATLSGFNDEGPLSSVTVDFAGAEPTQVELAEVLGASDASVMVESEAASLVVEHRLLHTEGASQVPCSTRSSDQWLFPTQTSLRGTSARLVLFNPFPKDATVDISAAVDDGVRSPPAWTGVVVPAGTRRTVELGEHADRRETFSVVVTTRTGRVVAETVQWLDRDAEGDLPAMHGLRLQLGVPDAVADHVFAGGFAGPGVQEQFVAYNPGDEATSALVQVIPYGAGELAPEPFEIEIGAHRFAVIDISDESRVPPTGLHAITANTVDGTPIVAGLTTTINDAATESSTEEMAQRPAISAGSTIGTGTPVLSARWWATGLLVGPEYQSSVLVHNPAAGVVTVSATVVGGPLDGQALAESVEIASGDSFAVQTTGIAENHEVSVLVEADGDVVVDRLIAFTPHDDFSMGLAVPLGNGSTARPVGQD